MLMLALVIGVSFPHVQSPWPETIGLGFPFTMAGVSGVLADMLDPGAPEADRNRAIRVGNVWGFRLGAFVYCIALVAQLGSGV